MLPNREPDSDSTVDHDAAEGNLYASVDEWVRYWLAPTLAGKLATTSGAGGRVWCAEWWQHPQVAVRLYALWQAWEAARLSASPDAMSVWWLHHADPHLRVLCDGTSGPMHRCTPTRHHDLRPYSVAPAPAGWFGPDVVEELPDTGSHTP